MMLDWLNRNAPAVQAFASVCSVVATVVLLRITWQYVGLTQELARAAREQLRFQERAVMSEAAQLVTLVDVFLGNLKRFPTAESSRTEVQRAIQRLNWIGTTAEHAQQTAKDGGEGLHDFPWQDWTRQIGEARTALQAVRADAQAFATS